tara:strand:- start:1026 stop:1244 length:219 start_codon:yes stop_codon:yes gene_type:complete
MTEEEALATVSIDNVDYYVADLSDNAKAQLQGLNIAMNELKRLELKKALLETARNAYGSSLAADLPKPAVKD